MSEKATTSRNTGVGAVTYGSLLSPEELNTWLSNAEERAIPVKVRGYRRIFNNEADWREMSGNQRAVLNVLKDDEKWFNGILIPQLSEAEYEEYIERESGYTLTPIEKSQISYYNESSRNHEIADEIQLPVGAKQTEGIEPIPEYLELCLEGAKEWGEEFYQDFLISTELQPGRTLDEYLTEE